MAWGAALTDDNVVILDGYTSLDIPGERVLNSALEAGLDKLFLIGELDGELYIASSIADETLVLWWLEKAKQRLMENGE